jgi:hypothetical protein
VIGPYFFAERSVALHNYIDMLESKLFAVPQIAHYANIIAEFLDETFPRLWMGRSGMKQWPPRSPDLTHLDFYFCEYVEQIVYSVRIHATFNIETANQRSRCICLS